MEINTKGLCANELRKVGLLITRAAELGMEIGGYGVADMNQNSGNVYLWLEDYSFCLFIGLGSDEIYANWTDPNNGEEHDAAVGNHTLASLEEWCSELFAISESEGE